MHVSVGRPQHLFLWKGDADVCASFVLIFILPFCSSLKFFSFKFSAATHILIGTLCLRRDSGIGVSTWFNIFCGGFGVCFVLLLWLVVMVAVCKRWQQYSSFFLPFVFLFSSFFSSFVPSYLLPFFLAFFLAFFQSSKKAIDNCAFFIQWPHCLSKNCGFCWLNCWKASRSIPGLDEKTIMLLFLWLLHGMT